MLYPMQKVPQFLFIGLLLFLFTDAGAQGAGRLYGKVVDRATQMPLAGISVTLQDSSKGTTTDSAGTFRLTDLPIKTYNIVFTGVGYKPQTQFNIVISAGNETALNIELEPAVASLSEVVI